MDKKGCVLYTALFLSASMAFAAQNDGMSTQSDTNSNAATSTTPSTDTGNTGTKSSTDTSTSGTNSSTDTGTSGTNSSTDTSTSGTKSSTDTGTSGTNSSTDTNTSGTKSSTDTGTMNTNSSTTPSSNEQGVQSGTSNSTQVNSTEVNSSEVNATNVDVNAKVTEVNNKVTIQGVTTAPTFATVEYRDNAYYIPETVTPVEGFYFLTIGTTERVCSLKKITKVKVLSTPTTTKVIIGKKKRVLYCYDRTYFNF